MPDLLLIVTLPPEEAEQAAAERGIFAPYVRRASGGESALVASMADYERIRAWWAEGSTLRRTERAR